MSKNSFKIPLYLKLGNKLYHNAYFLYRPLYYLYKKFGDRQRINFIKNFIKPGMQAIDIGANIGFYTALLSRKVGNEGSVYAFEPHSMNYRRLLNATKKFKNVKAFDYAIGEKSGRIKLYLSDELNVDHQSYDIGEGRKYSEVECYALDDFFDSEFKANFIKIDIQGYDFHAMKGMDAILERSDKIAILGELWPYGLLKSGSSPKEYMDYLKNKGFVVQYFTNDIDDYENKIYDKFFYTDFIAFKNFIQP